MTESLLTKFKNKACIVTGASSGIGLAIANMLVNHGLTVYGIGRNFSGDEKFAAVVCDLLDTVAAASVVKEIMAKDDVVVLINCAGSAYYGLHENISANSIHEMVTVDLEVPMLLTNVVMRSFKEKGNCFIINVSSVTASKAAPHGACYGACKAGLSAFSASIWEEARKHGVYITDICPDMTESNLYRNADFTTDSDVEARLEPEDVAQAVESVLSMREGVCVPSIKLMPRYNRIKRK